MWNIEELIKVTGGTPLSIEETVFSGISTDSRTIRKKEIFIPLKGPRFDGHEFIKEALEKSKGCAFCEFSKKDKIKNASGTIILVNDTKKVLFDLASYKRSILSGKVVGITGSNGKTTTKELIVHILKDSNIGFNEKNFNNIIGISNTLFSIKDDPKYLIFEIGTNARGEIKELTSLIRPSISLITHISPSHLEGLRDIHGVLTEKLDLFRGTEKEGTLVFNIDDPHLSTLREDFKQKKVTCGIINEADYSLRILDNLDWKGFYVELRNKTMKIKVRTPLLGIFSLYNILFSFTVASLLGVEPEIIKQGIETFEAKPGRFRPIRSKKGFTLIDDTYNANPKSMEYAIETFLKLPSAGKKILVLGDMKELGSASCHFHKSVGVLLKNTDNILVLFYGLEMKHAYEEMVEKAIFFHEKEGVIDYLKSIVEPNDAVLIKGSRALKMEEILEAIL